MLQRSMAPGRAALTFWVIWALPKRLTFRFVVEAGGVAWRGVAGLLAPPSPKLSSFWLLGHLGGLGYGKNIANFRRPYIY